MVLHFLALLFLLVVVLVQVSEFAVKLFNLFWSYFRLFLLWFLDVLLVFLLLDEFLSEGVDGILLGELVVFLIIFILLLAVDLYGNQGGKIQIVLEIHLLLLNLLTDTLI
jgi:hypothetical protein